MHTQTLQLFVGLITADFNTQQSQFHYRSLLKTEKHALTTNTATRFILQSLPVFLQLANLQN